MRKMLRRGMVTEFSAQSVTSTWVRGTGGGTPLSRPRAALRGTVQLLEAARLPALWTVTAKRFFSRDRTDTCHKKITGGTQLEIRGCA